MTDAKPSSADQEPVESIEPTAGRVLRPARALIGWIPKGRALLLLNSNRADADPTEGQRELIEAARHAVSSRKPGLDQTGVIQDLPTGVLDEHIERLRTGTAESYFAEGWGVALVELARVCAFQPTVFTDSAAERAGHIDVRDMAQLASLTLPNEWDTDQQAQLDQSRNLWLLASANPNLRVVGHFGGPVQPGNPPGFGFFVTIPPSFLQVATYKGRHFLRDGYHRAAGLLALGATMVPALVREFTSIEELVPQGMLPHEAFLGERPPLLADYANDDVAAVVHLAASQKMVVIQAIELSHY
jgi:hypothetical protein